jgi:hypothetical protein
LPGCHFRGFKQNNDSDLQAKIEVGYSKDSFSDFISLCCSFILSGAIILFFGQTISFHFPAATLPFLFLALIALFRAAFLSGHFNIISTEQPQIHKDFLFIGFPLQKTKNQTISNNAFIWFEKFEKFVRPSVIFLSPNLGSLNPDDYSIEVVVLSTQLTSQNDLKLYLEKAEKINVPILFSKNPWVLKTVKEVQKDLKTQNENNH